MTPEQIAQDLVDQFSWSSNRMLNGRLVGEQYFVAMAVADAIRAERQETARLRDALHTIQCQQLDRGTNKRLTALGHRRRAMTTRQFIIETLSGVHSTPDTEKP